jgi:hypothetical protein
MSVWRRMCITWCQHQRALTLVPDRAMLLGRAHDDYPDLGLDTTADVLSQLEDAPDMMHPSQPL